MIRRRVFVEHGEDAEGAFYRCEGDDGCDRWLGAKGDTFEQKLSACENCPKQCTPPPDPAAGVDEDGEWLDEIEDLVDSIAYIVAWEDAGIATDWTCYTFEHQKLLVVWRDAEKEVRRLQARWLHTYIKSKFKSPDA